jgi:hypothetical protein
LIRWWTVTVPTKNYAGEVSQLTWRIMYNSKSVGNYYSRLGFWGFWGMSEADENFFTDMLLKHHSGVLSNGIVFEEDNDPIDKKEKESIIEG